MKKIFEKIKNSSKKSKFLAVVLATAVCVTSVWHNTGDKPVEINAETAISDTSYLEYIIDRIIGGLQENFTILEIVPHVSQGEFRYYIGDDVVEEGLEANTALMEAYYKTKGCYINEFGEWSKTDEWFDMGTAFSNYGYEFIYYSETDSFEVESPKRFLNYVVPKYKELLEDRIELKTVEGNKLTEEDILSADFIIISTGTHDNNTIACYNSYTNPALTNTTDAAVIDVNVYKKTEADGTVTMTKVTNASEITYNTYEQITDAEGNVSYVSRDINWDIAEKLLDYTINGKTMELSDGSTVTTAAPVILDNQQFSNLNKDGNMYKYELLFRMLDKTLLEKILPYISDTYTVGGVETQYINSEGIATGVLSVDKTFTAETNMALNRDDIYTICGGSSSSYDIYRDANPPHATFLTNHYWVYSGDSCLIPSNMNSIYFNGTSKDEAGFYERVGTGATVIDVMKYLLGAPDDPIINFRKVKILEVQPCTVFDYDEYSEVKALAERLLLDVDGELKNSDGTAKYDPLTESNYNVDGANVCIHVDCISSSGFNGINTDILMEYDAVILGDNDDLLLKDDNGKTIYNDKNLNGYIYLAFGDLIEVKTGISIYYPGDYTLLNNNYTLNGYKLVTGTAWNERDLESTHENFRGWYRYSYMNLYTMQEELFNPLIYNGLTAGKYYILKNTNVLAKNASTTDAMLTDEAGNARLSGNDITQLKADALKEYMEAGKLLIMGEELYNYTDASTTIYPTSNIAEVAEYAINNDATRIKQAKIGSLLLYAKNRNPVLNFTVTPTEVNHDANGNINTFNATGLNLPFKFTADARANTTYDVKIYIDKNNDGVFYQGDDITNDMNEQFFDGTFTTDGNGDQVVEISLPLSDNYNGLVSYKLVVTELDSAGNMLPYRAGITGYTAIKGTELKDVYVLQILPIPYSNKTIHLDMSDPNGEFQRLLEQAGDVIGYNIVVNTVYTSQFEDWFDPNVVGGVPYDNSVDDALKNTDIYQLYDMVVLGFSDLYCGDDISNDNGALDWLYDFVESGKAVLFTHDTVSYSNTVNNVTYINTTSGWGWNQTTYMSLAAHGTNVWATSLSRMFREIVGMDRFGITSAETEADLKNAPIDKDGNIVHGLQGISNMLAYRHSVATDTSTGVTYQSDYDTTSKYMLYPYTTGSVSNYSALINTTHVTKLNDGQVTMYPYAIDDNLDVAVTHAQWYQLDMEDPSIVVWYTLAGDTVNNGQYYKDTDKDAANNYYIYSKGNITYSGAGHSSMDSPEELKLFVNTVIKAITAGNSIPEVHVVESSFGDGVYNTYVAPYSGEYEFTFYGEDLDLRPYVGRFETAKVVWENTSLDVTGDGTINADDKIVYYNKNRTLTSLTRTTINVTDVPDYTASGYAISAAKKQEIVEHMTSLIENKVGVYFSIKLTDMYGAVGDATVRLVQREPFDMD